MAVPVRGELVSLTRDLDRRLIAAAGRLVEERRTQVEGLGRGLPDPVRLMEELAQRLDERAERLTTALRTWLQTRQAEVARLSAALPHPRQQLKFAREHSAALGERLGALGRRLAEPQIQALGRVDAGRRLGRVLAQGLADRVTMLQGLGRVLESTSYHNVLARGFAVVRGPDGLLTGPEGVAPGLALDIEFAQDRHLPAVAGTTGVKRKTPARETAARGSAKDDPQGSLL
jgi:exodeoxyribonuclease VII large subunit